MTDLGEPKEELRQPIREIRFFEPDEKIVMQHPGSEDAFESRKIPIKQLGANAHLYLNRPHDTDEYINDFGEDKPAFAIQEDGTLIKGDASKFASDGYFEFCTRVEGTSVDAFIKNPIATRIRIEGSNDTLQDPHPEYSLGVDEEHSTTGTLIGQDFALTHEPDAKPRMLFVKPDPAILSRLRVSFVTPIRKQGGEA